MEERWGALSVKDHISTAPLVVETLLYDRLVIPVPPPGDSLEEDRWNTQQWQPKLLKDCLTILGIKTEKQDGLALTVPWGDAQQQRFDSKINMAAGLTTQRRAPEQTYYANALDPFQVTRQLLRDEFKPALPAGVSKSFVVASYGSTEKFRDDLPKETQGQKMRLALRLRHHFFSPSQPDPDHEMLKRAVDLATTDDFRRKRASFYGFQETIITEQLTEQKAIDDLEKLLKDYRDAVEKARMKVITRYVFTVIPIGLAMTGAAIAGSETGLVLAGSGGLVEMARFWMFDRKPVIENGDLDPAAMVHDAREVLSLN